MTKCVYKTAQILYHAIHRISSIVESAAGPFSPQKRTVKFSNLKQNMQMAMLPGKHTQPKVINPFVSYLYTAAISSTQTNY